MRGERRAIVINLSYSLIYLLLFSLFLLVFFYCLVERCG